MSLRRALAVLGLAIVLIAGVTGATLAQDQTNPTSGYCHGSSMMTAPGVSDTTGMGMHDGMMNGGMHGSWDSDMSMHNGMYGSWDGNHMDGTYPCDDYHLNGTNVGTYDHMNSTCPYGDRHTTGMPDTGTSQLPMHQDHRGTGPHMDDQTGMCGDRH